jgi:ribokinase
MKVFDVATFGTATRDIFVSPKDKFDLEKNKHAPEGKAIALASGAKIELGELIVTTGGGSTNAAVTFARQNLKTVCFCKVGDDPGGRATIEELKREKINTDFIKKDKKLSTAYGIILEAGKADRTILVYRGASEKITFKDFVLNKIKARWFYIAPLGGEAAKLFGPLVNHAYRENIKIGADLSKAQIKLGLKKLKPILNKIDVLKINREEASYLTKIPFRYDEKIFEKLDRAVKGIVIITDGNRGLKASDGTRRWQAGVFKEKNVRDRTGAGDAFGSAFVATLAKRKKISPTIIPEAIRVASANATSVVEFIGTKQGALTSRELKARRWQNLKVKEIKIKKPYNPYHY